MSLSAISQTALSGIWASETMLGVAANNLANLQTSGFKQSQVQLSTRPSVGPAGAQLGTGVQVAAIVPDTSQGARTTENAPLSLTISGDGYFVLEGPQGEHLYTRDGTFHVNADRELVSADGSRVLGWQGDPNVFQEELTPLFVLNPQSSDGRADAEQGAFAYQYHVGSNGVIRSRSPDGSSQTVAQIRLAQFNNPRGLRGVGSNKFQATASSGPAQLGNPNAGWLGRLQSFGHEASNSDVAQNLVSMSRAKQLYRANLKVLDVADSLFDELLSLPRH